MILGHVAGFPLEESILQLAPAAAAITTALAATARVTLGRLRRRGVGGQR